MNGQQISGTQTVAFVNGQSLTIEISGSGAAELTNQGTYELVADCSTWKVI